MTLKCVMLQLEIMMETFRCHAVTRKLSINAELNRVWNVSWNGLYRLQFIWATHFLVGSQCRCKFGILVLSDHLLISLITHSGLENFWASAFAYFFRSFLESDGHLWTLTPVSLPPVSSIWKWHQTSYSAKVRFHCSRHGGWTSVKGRALFWYRLRRQGDAILPEILFKLYGQQCNQCPEDLEVRLPTKFFVLD